MTTKSTRASRMRRALIGTLASLVLGLVAITFIGVVAERISGQEIITAVAQQGDSANNPRSAYWRQVRSGEAGYTTATGPEAGVLINAQGESYRELRQKTIPSIVSWALLITVVIIALFYLVVGSIKLDDDKGKRRVLRWSKFERFVHWVTAASFILMTISGLWLLLGRYLLADIIGIGAVAAGAKLSIGIHNFVGPILAVGILLEILMWIRHNIPNKHDFRWFTKGGGFGKEHPSAGRMNGGEKLFFWIICSVGVVVCITGLILVTPGLGLGGGTRAQSINMLLIHAVLSGFWTCVVLGHIYIGTLGTKGSLEGMVSGTVSEAWAKQHHDLWYKEQLEKGLVGTDEELTAARETKNVQQAEV